MNRLTGNSLASRCVRGSAVLGLAAIAAKFLGVGSKMLLTRLLMPQDMGLMVMVLSLTALFEVLTEVGIKQSVIQHKDGAEPEYLNMAWWFQSVRGTTLYLAAFLLAPHLCGFYFQGKAEIVSRYSMDELVSLTRVAFMTILLNGLVSPRAHVLEKQFRFGKAAIITQGGLILSSIVTILLALVWRSVWAIVIGSTSVSLFRCVLSHILCPYVPRIEYHQESLKALFRFARGMLGLPVLTYVAFNADLLVAGKLMAASVVGYYGMAQQLALSPRDLFARIVSPVILPAFAEKQDDNAALCGAVLKLTSALGIILFPAVVFAIMCGKTILALVYGSQGYATVAVAFGILCVYVALLIEGSVIGTLFFGMGKPEKHRMFVAVRALILLMVIYPATKMLEVNGAAFALLTACSAALCVQVFVVCRTISLRIREYLMAWLPGLLLATPVAVAIWSSQAVWPQRHEVHLAIGVVCSLVSSGGSMLVVWLAGRKNPASQGQGRLSPGSAKIDESNYA